jgi:hypothetical protein
MRHRWQAVLVRDLSDPVQNCRVIPAAERVADLRQRCFRFTADQRHPDVPRMNNLRFARSAEKLVACDAEFETHKFLDVANFHSGRQVLMNLRTRSIVRSVGERFSFSRSWTKLPSFMDFTPKSVTLIPDFWRKSAISDRNRLMVVIAIL